MNGSALTTTGDEYHFSPFRTKHTEPLPAFERPHRADRVFNFVEDNKVSTVQYGHTLYVSAHTLYSTISHGG